MRAAHLRRIAASTLFALLLPGCAQKITLEKYNQLKIGQSYDEVKQIVGEPASCDELLGMRSCVWGNEQSGIHVGFMGGTVVLLSAQNLK